MKGKSSVGLAKILDRKKSVRFGEAIITKEGEARCKEKYGGSTLKLDPEGTAYPREVPLLLKRIRRAIASLKKKKKLLKRSMDVL